MPILTPVRTKWFFAPVFRKHTEQSFAKFDHLLNIMLTLFVLCAFTSIVAYADTSILFGPFLAGVFLTYIPSNHPDGLFVVMSREGEREKDKSSTFLHMFECYCLSAQEHVLELLFFASISFAIPFLDL